MRNKKNTRFFDVVISSMVLLIFSPLMIIIFIICLIESGSPIFIQDRVGKNQKPFKLFKFRTMKLDTPTISSHLVKKNSVLKFGRIIRSLKLDELPQLINVLKGDMSLVGPRPCLFNQKKLRIEREKKNVFSIKPGITGLSQIKGIDMSDPERLANNDAFMITNFNQVNYFKYLFLTLYGKGIGDKISNFRIRESFFC